jgi:hypothetical protein
VAVSFTSPMANNQLHSAFAHSRLSAVVCAWCVAVLSVARGENVIPSAAEDKELDHLLERLATNDRRNVERDSDGNVISVFLRGGLANDENVQAIARLKSIRTLRMQGRAQAGELTAKGIAPLAQLTNMTVLSIACIGELTPGVFREVCTLRGLNALQLTATYAPPSEYACITNLPNLSSLYVSYCTNFGDGELASLTNLPQLKDLTLDSIAVSKRATNILNQMKRLTNITIWPPTGTIDRR